MTAHVRLGDPTSCGDVIARGSGNCFVNGLPVARLGDVTAGHCYNSTPIIQSASTVYFNNKLAAMVGNQIQNHTCGTSTHGGFITVGSPNCFVEDSGAPVEVGSMIIDQYVQSGTHPLDGAQTHADDDGSDPVYVSRRRQMEAAFNVSPLVTPQSTIPAPITVAASPPPIDCADIYQLGSNFPGNFQLSPNFTLSMLTTHTRVSNYQLKAQNHLSAADIVCNLRQLCINVLEPLKATYGSTLVINSGFRYGTGKSQHYTGEAVDVAFTDVTSASTAWQRAQQLTTATPFDQYIFEQNRSFWYHLSYSTTLNRQQVLSKPVGDKYYPGLVKFSG